ncbi:MAG: hybrid sensor histidine kinase/response regulator transcription factor [Phocaeicola sp.]
MKRTLYILIYFLLLLFSSIHSKDSNQYVFQQVGLKDGLSSSVPCLAVSSEMGYVWIGTKSGIKRFDGYQLKKYTNHSTTHLLEDRENKIWAVSNGYLFYYDEISDCFLQAKDQNEQLVSASTLSLWSDGVVVVADTQIYKYDYESGEIKRLSLSNATYYDITTIQEWDSQTILATGRYRAGILINMETGKTEPTPFPSENLATCLIDSEERVWLSPYNEGVTCYTKRGELLESLHLHNSKLQSNAILHLAESNGQVWMATDGAGIYIYNLQKREMTELRRIPGDSYSLPVNTILYLCSDARNGVWAGSVRGGLINIKEAGMKTYTDALPGGSYGLSDKAVLSICQDRKGDIWIGTDGGGVNLFNPNSETFTHFPATQGDKITSIADIDENKLLVSLFNEGVYYFDKKVGKYTPLIVVNDSVNARICRQGESVNLLNDGNGNVLLLSKHPYKYNLSKCTFAPITYHSNYQLTGVVRSVCNDSTKSLLFDYRRVFRLNENNHLENLLSCSGDTIFNSLAMDENGLIWIGSNKGLSYYCPTTKKHIQVSHHLINEVNSLICDMKGNVWLGASEKLFSHRTKEGDFILYGESDGALINDYLERPRLLSKRQRVYMGGVNGLLRINEIHPQDDNDLPILRLTDVWVGGERINMKLTKNNRIEVVESEKSLSIRMVASNKDIFQKPMFRYTLRGSSDEISYSYQPDIMISRLPVGSYKLLASCSTRRGGWTQDYEIVTLEIFPVWYRTEEFRIFLFLSIITALIYWFFKRNERKMKWLMKEREQKAYKEKVSFLININHELRTPLTLIHAPLKQLLEGMELSDPQYPILRAICNQSDRMRKLLNTVLDVHKMEMVQSCLHIEEIDLDGWIEGLIDEFRLEANAKGVLFHYQPNSQIKQLNLDKEKCTTVLTNLLINAVKYTNHFSCITIAVGFCNDSNRVRISIKDQGDGLAGVDMDHLFTRFYQGSNSRPGTGIGLSYSKILVEQQGGSIGAYDSVDEPGAIFWIEIPCDLVVGDKMLQPQSYLNELLSPLPHEESEVVLSAGVNQTIQQTLLVVDDNKELTDYLYTTFKERFKKVWVAADGREALAICKAHRPSIVVSDIQMPAMNGYELCKAIKEDLEISHIPIILLTAINEKESELFGYKNGADAYLTKPFEVDILYTMMCSLLKNRERIRTCYSEPGQLPEPQESTFSLADEAFLSKLNQLIVDNLNNEQLGVPFLSHEMAMSRSSLYNKLKALTDMGVNDYITKFRIEQAIKLLMDNELPINEISDVVGFSTSRYFSTVFKQHTGLTPTQYKKEKSLG